MVEREGKQGANADYNKILLDLIQASAYEHDLFSDSIFEVLGHSLFEYTPVDLLLVGIVDRHRNKLVIRYQFERDSTMPGICGAQLSLIEDNKEMLHPAVRSILSNRPVEVEDIAKDPGLEPWKDLYELTQLQSLMAVPIDAKPVFMVLIFHAKAHAVFNESFADAMTTAVTFLGQKFRQQEELLRFRQMIRYDSLTGLASRDFFLDQLSDRLKHSEKGILIRLDIDDFRFYNDLLGYENANALLLTVSARLSEMVRNDELIGRLGSDEFGLWLRMPAKINEDPTSRLSVVLREPITTATNHAVNLGFSAGLASFPDDGRDADTLLRRSGLALRRSKLSGGRMFYRFADRLEDDFNRRQKIRNEFEKALEESRVEAWFQPQVDLTTGRVVGLEALARIRRENDGVMTPDHFIAEVEADARLIRYLGIAMLKRVGEHMGDLEKMGLNVPVAVNIGARHLLSPAFQSDFKEILGRFPGLKHILEIEVTESESLSDFQRAKEVLFWVRKQGVKVTLDDFGSGYASIGNARDLPLNKLKLDQSFIRNLPGSLEDQTIVSAVVVATRGLEMQLVAEGVESDEHAELLGALGVSILQGYAIGRPMPLLSLRQWYGVWRYPSSWRHWARPMSKKGSALQCVGAWFGLRQWLKHPQDGTPESVRSFYRQLIKKEDTGCPPQLDKFQDVFISLYLRIEKTLNQFDSESREVLDLLSEVEAMGRLMRKSIGISSLIG